MFGDGPDGGREATAEGTMRWDGDREPAEAVWEGYTVVQAKFRLRPTDAASNLDWLLTELRKELSRWTDKRYRRSENRKPDNLLIVTNVPLSAASGGGIDTANLEISNLIADHELQLQNWRLWHYDDLCTLLDAHRSVRITYGGYLTSGDVLARMDDWLERHQTDLGSALTTHAIKDLLAQQYVRLGQAGDPHEDKLSLDSIGIDLPAATVSYSYDAWLLQQLETLDRKTQEAVQSALSIALTSNEMITPEQIKIETRKRLERPRNTVPAAAYIVHRGDRVGTHDLRPDTAPHLLVVGGPGQGKSTLAQMVCQAYRVRLLRDASLSPEANRLRNRLQKHFDEIGLPLPQNLRWPIRVVLSEYGEYLTANPGRSLLRYLAERISDAGPYDIRSTDLHAWLGRWPWILVLDGMDEVVSPHVRDAVTAGISDFLVDVAQANADVLVIVTTRPQGYTGEFGAEDYQQVDLVPLKTKAALAYAQRLTSVRLSEDSDFRQKVQDRLLQASAEPETSRLMRTPLQVTIMTLLLERRQRAPHDRYQLFNAYFDTIYARETNKPTDLGRFLEDHRADIEAIHESVALELQQQAERVSEHDNSIPTADLNQHAIDRLRREGNDNDHAMRLASRIGNAATNRLVLLVPHGDGGVGFEVRSLQEYMAARALTRGEASDILDRLRPLVPSAHWRNTWMLAAGRLFRERESLREPLISILQQVDNENMLPWLVRPGAELATYLLADDLAIKSPQYRRLMADQALDRLNGLPDATWRDLGAVLLQLAEEDALIRQKIDQHVSTCLARGGGAQAHALLMLKLWEKRTGSLAARARQLIAANAANADLTENFGFYLIQSYGRTASPTRIQNGPRLAAYLSPLLAGLDQESRASLLRVLGSLPRNCLKKVVRKGSPTDYLVMTELKSLNHASLEEAFSNVTVADAFAELVDRIPPHDWHVAAGLRDVARYWHARRVATQPD
ncbi:NACHT domain-containing protein [Nonomuraea sp. NPDC001831]|uniref:NACHT domain-containing protein n=1 Tax=Nonomuraea sp. NPDC001831 TaxID=3364340 RepID=UPI003686D9B3